MAIGEDIWLYILVGFAAQIVDGAIGMAYGVISTSILLAAGMPPAPASAAVHMAKIFTGAASGLSHWRFGNTDFRMVVQLALPGAIGAAIGAVVVSHTPLWLIKPAVAIYLAAIGAFILYRTLRKRITIIQNPRVGLLGGIGGLVDAMGGGWGPVVTSTLMAKGGDPRLAIGSANLAEFFVSIVSSAVFFAALGTARLDIVLALVIGGVAAAPVGAYLTTRIPARLLILSVGCVVAVLSIRNLSVAF
ncbi:MAG: sulfite exporter TauE/SafE family protein [Alphaproteobacteria bacterium]